MYKHIEMRGDNLLRAVVEGTEANAHLVARNGLGWGVQHAAEQYHIPVEKVLSAIKFYLDDQEEIDRLYKKAFENAPSKEEQIERIKRKSEAYRRQMKKSS